MPTYTYRCNGPVMHTFDKRAGYDDEETICTVLIPCLNCRQAQREECNAQEACGMNAYRRPYYEDTAVSFTGTGFTQTVIPPAKPQAGTIKGEPTSDWFERLDRHAERVYRDDEDVEPYRKKQAKEMLKQIDKGGLV